MTERPFHELDEGLRGHRDGPTGPERVAERKALGKIFDGAKELEVNDVQKLNSEEHVPVRIKEVVARRKDAYDADGKLKANVISVKELAEANPEVREVLDAVGIQGSDNLNFLDSELEELNVAAAVEEEFIIIEIVLDSGAGEHVADRLDAPGYSVEVSEGSRRGQNFLAAGGHRMRNEGQVQMELVVPSAGDKEEAISSIFQVAKVTRPLWSVSKICDQGHWVKFRKHDATVFTEDNVPVCVFQRKGGLYVGRVKLRNPKHPGFRRPEQR